MRVENERCEAETERRNPEIDQMRYRQRHCHVEQHDQRPHTKVDTWASKTRVQCAEIDTGRCETTTSCNIPSTTVGQIT